MINTIFYSKLDEHHRPRKIYRHKIGTPIKNDQLIYKEKDEGFTCGIGISSDEKYFLIKTSRSYLPPKYISLMLMKLIQNLNYLKKDKKK